MPRYAVNQDRLIEHFLALVTRPSLSGQEGEVADLVAAELADLGFAVERDEAGRTFGGEAGNVIARLPGRGETVLFCAHLDTVGPVEGIMPRRTDGRITTSGNTVLGADDKAAVAGVMEALRVVLEQSLPRPPLEIVFTVGEEIGLKGARALNFRHLRSKLAYVADSHGPVGGLINRGPGQDALAAVVTGKAAHAGIAPERGVNAIKIAAAAIAAMRLGRIDEETTANIGVIQGGLASNIVPERVELQGEARSHSDEKREAQVQHMLECLHRAAAELGGGVRTEVEPMYRRFFIPEDHPLVSRARAAMRQVGVRPRVQSTGGGSDANVMNERGLPAVLLGVGYENVHTKKEYIRVEQLAKFAELIVAIITTGARG